MIEIRLTADAGQVVEYLSNHVEWGRWRTPEQIRQQIDTAFRSVYAVQGDRVVGFVRAFSDGVSAAYVADMYVVPEFRGQGIAGRMMEVLIEAGPQFRWMLHSSNEGRGLYEKFGFSAAPGTYMERTRPGG